MKKAELQKAMENGGELELRRGVTLRCWGGEVPNTAETTWFWKLGAVVVPHSRVETFLHNNRAHLAVEKLLPAVPYNLGERFETYIACKVRLVCP